MTDERITAVIDNLSSLILSNARLVASEQYSPGPSPDDSDEKIRERSKWVTELRAIRERFENLITGMLP
jgi:hypothetical protein